MAFDQLGRTPPLPPSWHSEFGNLFTHFFILMDSIHFKTDFSMNKIYFFFSHFLHSPTIHSLKTVLYLLSFEDFNDVCTVLIWFILTVLQESSNLEAIFIVCRKKKKRQINKLVFLQGASGRFFF